MINFLSSFIDFNAISGLNGCPKPGNALLFGFGFTFGNDKSKLYDDWEVFVVPLLETCAVGFETSFFLQVVILRK